MTSTPPAFGRRQVASPAPTAASPAVEPLSASAERFKAELAASARELDGFAAWRRDQSAKRGLAWLVTFALLTPGVLCFVLKAPNAVSSAVEMIGIAGGWWLRRERRRHLKAIAEWRADSVD